ncbi:endolytic transglycosylase MltG [Streptomyces kronopolitis]|uniref:endolytic transglycosylase MltG n=1 Tax=Streptomyces kronopolitis TaxID=1612435 RepID=UPI0020C0C859|nr:endolytic transglycosylase MltG [Streptomyces kronopolitis]MCL6297378.1 endolytic transglycosylase MltG [Streptomyces kronopolitis]
MSEVQHAVHRPGPWSSRRGPRCRRGRLLLTAVLVVLLVLGGLLLARWLLGRQAVGTLTVPEGQRAGQIYAAADKALKVPAGSTARAARSAHLTLPDDAHGNPEGYLFPATYPLRSDTTPASLLSYMVRTARGHLADRGVSSYRTVVIASIVQAEADRPADMGKVARVITNRLDHHMPLQMDSTLNYALGRSTLRTSHADTRINSPYNTYRNQGLPPTPIDSPGADALRAAGAPPAGDWLYFVTVTPGDTRFTADYQRHLSNVREFNRRQRDEPSGGAMSGGGASSGGASGGGGSASGGAGTASGGGA